jgi:hypothetical protein
MERLPQVVERGLAGTVDNLQHWRLSSHPSRRSPASTRVIVWHDVNRNDKKPSQAREIVPKVTEKLRPVSATSGARCLAA